MEILWKGMFSDLKQFVCVLLFCLSLAFFMTPPLAFSGSALGAFSFAFLIILTLCNDALSIWKRVFIVFIAFFVLYTVLYQLVFITYHLSGWVKKFSFIIWNTLPYVFSAFVAILAGQPFNRPFYRILIRVVLFWSISICLIQWLEPFLIPAYFSNGLYFSDYFPRNFFELSQNPELLSGLFLLLAALLFWVFRPSFWRGLVLSFLFSIVVFGVFRVAHQVSPRLDYSNFSQQDARSSIKILSVEAQDNHLVQNKNSIQRTDEAIRLFAEKNQSQSNRLVVFAESNTLFDFNARNGDAILNFLWIRRLAQKAQTNIFIHVRGSVDINNPSPFNENKSYFVVIWPSGQYFISEKRYPMYLAEQQVTWGGNPFSGIRYTGMANGKPSAYLKTSFGLKVIPAICFDGVFPAVLDTSMRQGANLILVSANLNDFQISNDTYRFQMASHITQGMTTARSMGIPYVFTSYNGGGFAFSPDAYGNKIEEAFKQPQQSEFIERIFPLEEMSKYHWIPSAWMKWITLILNICLLGLGVGLALINRHRVKKQKETAH